MIGGTIFYVSHHNLNRYKSMSMTVRFAFEFSIMNFNLNLLALFGFIGTVFGGLAPQVSSADLVEFENTLRRAESGNQIGNAITRPLNYKLADNLEEMASKPDDYILPITDKYHLFRFYNAIIAENESLKKIANSKSSKTIPELEAELAAKDAEIEKNVKNSFSSWFNGYDLVIERSNRHVIQTQLSLAKQAEEARVALPKFEKFFAKFKPVEKRDELRKLDYVNKKYEEDFKPRRNKGRN